MSGCDVFIRVVAIVVFRWSTALSAVLGVMIGIIDEERYDPDESNLSGEQRPHDDFLCHSRVSFCRGIRHGYRDIQQAACRISRAQGSSRWLMFFHEMHLAEAGRVGWMQFA